MLVPNVTWFVLGMFRFNLYFSRTISRKFIFPVVVTSLLSDLLGLGYKLFVGNWYTSEVLFDYLYENKTYAVGTVRKNRLKLPKSVTNEK